MFHIFQFATQTSSSTVRWGRWQIHCELWDFFLLKLTLCQVKNENFHITISLSTHMPATWTASSWIETWHAMTFCVWSNTRPHSQIQSAPSTQASWKHWKKFLKQIDSLSSWQCESWCILVRAFCIDVDGRASRWTVNNCFALRKHIRDIVAHSMHSSRSLRHWSRQSYEKLITLDLKAACRWCWVQKLNWMRWRVSTAMAWRFS